MIPSIHLDYQQLRTMSSKAVGQTILQIVKSFIGNVSKTTRILSITRPTVYKAIRKQKAENLDDYSPAPKKVANKTPSSIEERVINLKQKNKLLTN